MHLMSSFGCLELCRAYCSLQGEGTRGSMTPSFVFFYMHFYIVNVCLILLVSPIPHRRVQMFAEGPDVPETAPACFHPRPPAQIYESESLKGARGLKGPGTHSWGEEGCRRRGPWRLWVTRALSALCLFFLLPSCVPSKAPSFCPPPPISQAGRRGSCNGTDSNAFGGSEPLFWILLQRGQQAPLWGGSSPPTALGKGTFRALGSGRGGEGTGEGEEDVCFLKAVRDQAGDREGGAFCKFLLQHRFWMQITLLQGTPSPLPSPATLCQIQLVKDPGRVQESRQTTQPN